MKPIYLSGLLLPLVLLSKVNAAPAPTDTAADNDDESAPLEIRITEVTSGQTVRSVLDPARMPAQPPTRTRRFRIEDFRPEYLDNQRYYVVEFSAYNSAVKRGAVTREGELTADFQAYRGRPGAAARAPAEAEAGAGAGVPEAELRSWFFSVNQNTGQLLLTLDFTDVPLAALIRSLSTALDQGSSEALLESAVLPVPSEVPAAAETVSLKIRGSHMTLRETFDLIYQQTGCKVFRERGRVLVTVCE